MRVYVRQKRIGGDVLVLDINAFQQWNERADLIGLLGFVVALYG